MIFKAFGLLTFMYSLACIAAHGEGVSAVEVPTLEDAWPSYNQVEDLAQPGLGIAPAAPARPLTTLARELIKYFERWMASAYDDSAHYCTIGFGHLIALKRCSNIDLASFKTPLSVLQGEQLLEKDLSSSRLAVEDLVTSNLNDDQFGSLVSFVFNVGKGHFQKSTLLLAINNGDYDEAAGEFGRWVKAGGVVQKGLITRRACEAALFRSSLQLDATGHFSRKQCEALGIGPSVGPLIDIEKGE